MSKCAFQIIHCLNSASQVELHYVTVYRALLPRAPASPIFSLQIDPLPDLENNPIMMVFDVVR